MMKHWLPQIDPSLPSFCLISANIEICNQLLSSILENPKIKNKIYNHLSPPAISSYVAELGVLWNKESTAAAPNF